MVQTTSYQSPDAFNAVGGGEWGVFPAPAFDELTAVQAPDDDSSSRVASTNGNGTNRYETIYGRWSKIFTGLPVNTQIVRVGFRFRRAAQVASHAGVSYRLQSQTWFVAGTAGTTYATTSTFWQTVSGLTANGSGEFTGTIDLGLNSSINGNGGTDVTTIELVLEYNSLPTAPTLTAPIGTIGTLTPTMQGNHNDPDGDAMSHVEIEVRRVSDDALFWASGQVSDTGTTFSQGYAGTTLVTGTQYKWRARTRDSGGGFGAWAAFTNFTPVTNVNPTTSIVSPTGGALVGTVTPTLQFTYSDADGNPQSGYQIRVQRVSDAATFWDPGQQAGAITSVVYAGTALVPGTAYQWRVRVQDNQGGWSDYTAYGNFTPQAIPNPPTSLLPSGLQGTLTPTVSGVYNQGAGGTEVGFQYEFRQASIVIFSSADVLVAIATGQVYGGAPALAWGTNYEVRARSKDNAANYSAWTSWQAFSTNAAPTNPTSLQPNGAITGDTTPTLTWVHNDPNGDAQTEAEVQLQTAGGTPVTGYDPKTLIQSAGNHTVTETLIASPVTNYVWRVRTKATSGPGFGPWSSWASFSVSTAPSFVLTAPVEDEVVALPAYNFQWTFSGGSGFQQNYRLKVFADDQVTVLHDTGVVVSDDDNYTIPSGLMKNGNTYYVQVSGEDTLVQAAQSGLVQFTTAWTPPATITGVQAQAIGSQE